MCTALKPRGDDSECFFAPFIQKPLTEQFPCSSVGTIMADIKGTSVIRVALISVECSLGQLGLFSGPCRGQSPSSHCWSSPGSGAGRRDTLAPGAPISRALYPMTSSRGWHMRSLAAAHPLGTSRQPCSSHCAAGKPQQLTCFFPIYFAASNCCGCRSWFFPSN